MVGDERHVFYGELMRILQLNIPSNDDFWGNMQGRRLLIAVIAPCRGVRNQDATQSVVAYAKNDPSVVALDLAAVQNVVGRVFTRGKWGIIDRSSSQARTVFVDNLE